MFNSNASAVSGDVNYIEDVFSTWLYVGNTPALNTINNGIDLAGKGGLVWIKERNAGNHSAWDTARGAKNLLIPNQTAANLNIPVTYPAFPDYGLQAFNSNGFTLGKNWEGENANGSNIVSWTFRKQPKFFDVVTYTGNNTSQTISHNLGSVPGCIIVKGTSNSGRNWAVWHRSLGSNNDYLWLESTAAQASSATYWNNTAPTSTGFTVGGAGNTNGGSETYVAYLFAHDAGGFGLTGTDNVISCGSFTTDGSGNATVSLGYEPQWLMVKASSATQSWYIEDNMRAFNLTQRAILFPNLSNAEATGASAYLAPNSTGFAAVNGQLNASTTYIYIAIRRGPMKVPTTGTSVFSPNTITTTPATFNIGFPLDLIVNQPRNGAQALWGTRLQGPKQYLDSSSTAAEVTAGTAPWAFDKQNDSYANYAGTSVAWNFRRAPSFFDEVCYTGTGANRTLTHNLAAAPELWIVKLRGAAAAWAVGSTALANTEYLLLNTTDAKATGATYWNSTYPTATTLSLGAQARVNDVGTTAVAYLFATCAGVSKVGGYTGTGTTQTINCGFTGGARFVLIKRTDSTGDWYVWDSARGIIPSNDPYLLMNSTAAEVTGTDYVDTTAVGFELSSTAPAALNANGGTYIFLAIA